MNDSREQQSVRSSRARRRSSLAVGVTAVTLAFAASLVAIAFASGGAVTVTSASNSTLGEQITVDARGHTLYFLSPETSHHLLCKSSECLKFWPPLTVRSSKTKLKAGKGVHGHLGILRRSDGKLQVTLGGLPLYRYSGDRGKGEVNGQDLHSFGGTWHVLAVKSGASPTAPVTSTTTSMTTTTAPAPTPAPQPTTTAPVPTPTTTSTTTTSYSYSY